MDAKMRRGQRHGQRPSLLDQMRTGQFLPYPERTTVVAWDVDAKAKALTKMLSVLYDDEATGGPYFYVELVTETTSRWAFSLTGHPQLPQLVGFWYQTTTGDVACAPNSCCRGCEAIYRSFGVETHFDYGWGQELCYAAEHEIHRPAGSPVIY
jgi:hypothetical protein